ncbi:MAG: lytic transglycosylase domain-containing protein, partial [Paracoccaceae bacterium]
MFNIKLIIRIIVFVFTFSVFWGPSKAIFANEISNFRSALDFAAKNAWSDATSAAKSISPAARDVIEWHRLRAGVGKIGDYEVFLAHHADWPGLPYLLAKGESAAAMLPDARRIELFFKAQKPRTGEGAVALVRAYLDLGKDADAVKEASRAWRSLSFNADGENTLLKLMPKTLAKAHEARLSWLLWEGDKTAQAKRMLPRVSAGARALGVARIALQKNVRGVSTLINAIQKSYQDDAGLAFDRFLWRLRKDLDTEAAEILLSRSSSAKRLQYPEAWAYKRASLVRALLRDNQPKLAYRVAASHQLSRGADFAVLEFLSGFIALRKLSDPHTALAHFQALEKAVSTPISTTRANYWQGRSF